MSAGVIFTNALARIETPGGDVLHALKSRDDSYCGFGEAYFSWVKQGAVKAWKRHLRMTMNLIVPVGGVRFVFLDENGRLPREEIIGVDNYARLTVPPGVWFGFQGLAAPESLVLNIADIPHDPDEVERRGQSDFCFDWT